MTSHEASVHPTAVWSYPCGDEDTHYQPGALCVYHTITVHGLPSGRGASWTHGTHRIILLPAACAAKYHILTGALGAAQTLMTLPCVCVISSALLLSACR